MTYLNARTVPLALALLLAAPALRAQALPDGSAADTEPTVSDIRIGGFELETGIVGPKNAHTTIGVGGTLDLGMLRRPWLGLAAGVGYWSSSIDRSELGSRAQGTIRDLSLHTDVRWSAFQVKRVVPYLVTGVALHRVSAEIDADQSLEEALTGTTLGSEIGVGVLKAGAGLGWRAEYRKRFAGDADSWGLTVGARWAFDAPPARARASSPERSMPAARWSAATPGGSGITTASLTAPVEPAAAESDALRMLMDENRTLRRELAALRENVAARNALASLGVEPMLEPELAGPAPVRTSADAFPLVPGERREIDGVSLDLDNPVSDARTRAALDVWGALLAAHPDVRVRVRVFGADADPARALTVTERQARILKSYLEVMGAAPHQVVAIGLGRSGAETRGVAPSHTVEIERLR